MLLQHGRRPPTIFVFGALLNLHVKAGQPEKAVDLLQEMAKYKVEMNYVSFKLIARACAKSGNFSVAKKLFDTVQQGVPFAVNLVDCTQLVQALASQPRYLGDALEVLYFMKKRHIYPDPSFFVCLLSACSTPADLDYGIEIHKELTASKVPFNTHLKTALLTMYGNCGSLDKVNVTFWSFRKEFNPLPLEVWNAMLAALVNLKQPSKILALYEEMRQLQIKSDDFTYSAILTACADLAARDTGRQIHKEIIDNGLTPSLHVYTSLINFYSKSGNFEEACSIFNSISQQNLERNVITWTSLLAACAQHGKGSETLEYFEKMIQCGIKPNSVTLQNILNACSHAGLVDKSIQFLNSMETQYQITPTVIHYTCVIDALSRSNRLEEAEQMLQKHAFNDTTALKTLLGGCRTHNDLIRAKRIADHALTVDPNDVSVYVLLANIHSHNGQWEEAEKIKSRMKAQGLKKTPGQSSIEINGGVHIFVAGDKSHEKSAEIYAKLAELNTLMKAQGYVPDVAWALHDGTDGEKEEILCSHRYYSCFCMIPI